MLQVDISLIVKTANKSKLNSHQVVLLTLIDAERCLQWFLSAFARDVSRCEFVMLTDCGTCFDRQCIGNASLLSGGLTQIVHAAATSLFALTTYTFAVWVSDTVVEISGKVAQLSHFRCPSQAHAAEPNCGCVLRQTKADEAEPAI